MRRSATWAALPWATSASIRAQDVRADSHPEWFTNRELSWLAFNRRVLEEARDPQNPLLERMKFLAIVDSNLSEFLEVRVAGLRQQAEAGVADRNPDGLSPAETLHAIDLGIREMVAEQYDCWLHEIVPSLEKENIRILRPAALGPEEAAWLTAYFDQGGLPCPDPDSRRSRAPLPACLEQEPFHRCSAADRRSPAA